MSIYIGKLLYGNCNGYFDVDGYNIIRRIEAIGVDWIVARRLTEDAIPNFATVSGNSESMEDLINKWSDPKNNKEYDDM